MFSREISLCCITDSNPPSPLPVGTDENSRRISNVENTFGISGVTLANEGRVLVGEGVLKKCCRKKLKPRQFFLFNDILVYGSIVIRNKKYTRQHIIPLENVKIEDLVDEEGKCPLVLVCSYILIDFCLTYSRYDRNQVWLAHSNAHQVVCCVRGFAK